MLACTLAAALADGPAVASGEPAAFTVLGSGFTGEPFPLGGDLVAESDSLVVTIRDVGDPLRPRVLGWLDHAADCYWSQIVADGPLLIGLTGDVSAGVVGFSVVDFADPLAPVDHGVISGMPFDSGWLRGRALLATAGGLLVTYDLADLGAPAVTGFVPLGSHAGPRWPATASTRWSPARACCTC